jgi:hypothetical protein
MAHTASLLVLLVLLVAAAKKVKNALGRGGTNIRHITKLVQSIFSLDIYGLASPCMASFLPYYPAP